MSSMRVWIGYQKPLFIKILAQSVIDEAIFTKNQYFSFSFFFLEGVVGDGGKLGGLIVLYHKTLGQKSIVNKNKAINQQSINPIQIPICCSEKS